MYVLVFIEQSSTVHCHHYRINHPNKPRAVATQLGRLMKSVAEQWQIVSPHTSHATAAQRPHWSWSTTVTEDDHLHQSALQTRAMMRIHPVPVQ